MKPESAVLAPMPHCQNQPFFLRENGKTDVVVALLTAYNVVLDPGVFGPAATTLPRVPAWPQQHFILKP